MSRRGAFVATCINGLAIQIQHARSISLGPNSAWKLTNSGDAFPNLPHNIPVQAVLFTCLFPIGFHASVCLALRLSQRAIGGGLANPMTLSGDITGLPYSTTIHYRSLIQHITAQLNLNVRLRLHHPKSGFSCVGTTVRYEGN